MAALKIALFLVLTLVMKCEGQSRHNTPPIFNSPTYIFDINEEEPAGSIVGRVGANDLENDDLLYSFLMTSSDGRYFTMNISSGVISTTMPIDRERLISTPLRVLARVIDTSGADAVVEVYVNVLDINDNSPSFTNLPNTLTLAENIQVGTSVFAADAHDADESLNAAILYNMVPNDTFGINPSSGEITLNQGLDYDVRDGRRYFLTIFAQDRATGNNIQTAMSTLNITVTDINDQDPVFDQTLYSVVVHENLTNGSSIVRVTAQDQDEGINDDVVYSIYDGNYLIGGIPSFSINASTGLITVNVPMLDREIHNMYLLLVEARERNSPTNRARTMVNITVLDINDHIPSFEMQRYQVNVSENAEVNDTLIHVVANDHDEGVHALFEFFLVNVLSSDELPFTVSSSSMQNYGVAEITLTQELDYENQTIYRFMVIARETIQNNASYNSTIIEVYVVNENDNNPIFDEDVYTYFISENIPSGDVIAMVHAADEDAGTFGDLVYSLSDSDRNKPFNITTSGGYGIITTSGRLDFEEDQEYELTVIVEDLAENKAEIRSNMTTVIVVVENENDNTPYFMRDGMPLTAISLTVLEAQPYPLTILMLEAVDEDGTLNDLTLSIDTPMENFLGFFVIDQERQLLNTTQVLEFDSVTPNLTSFSLTISANDTKFVGYVQVNIDVIDVNDNSPQFLNDSYSFSVVENFPAGSVVGQVEAVDIDSGSFGQVVYSLSGETNVTDSFQINATSGEIYVAAAIDREQTPGPLSFTVVATDSDSNILERNANTASVSILVLDANDNAPSFTQDNYLFHVPENTAQLSVFTMPASDPDLGSNGEFTFSILGGNEDETFIINPLTGELTRNQTSMLDFERVEEYRLNVSARDHGDPSNLATVLVVIAIIDENDVIPSFSMTQFNVTISEDINPNTEVTTLTAEDEDSGEFGNIIYSILEVQPQTNLTGTFTIDNTTGTVYSLGIFDRELFAGPYSVTVKVCDGGMPPNTGSTILFVSIMDANDETPIFDPVIMFPSPLEEQLPGIVVATIQATDNDQINTDNSRIEYYISDVSVTGAPGITINSSLNLREHFALNLTVPSNIVTNVRLDFEFIRSYVITVTAKDNGFPILSSSIVVPVDVVDINDHEPIFSFPDNTSTYRASIFENAPFTRILEFSASDQDSGNNAQISFTATNGLPNGFDIIGNTLTVSENSLDFEGIRSYRFNVTASDGGNPELSSVAPVEIMIEDLNDNSPSFSATTYYADLNEGNYTANSTSIVLVNATDLDSEEFGNVSYAVFPANNLFSVIKLNTGEGDVRAEGIFDRESVDEYTITILARDGGIPPRTSTTTVIVTVNDVNDNTPILSSPVYITTLPEGEPPQVLAGLDVSATDLDLGTNSQILYFLSNDSNFEINMESGVIQSRRTFDFEVERSFVLEIISMDNATNSLYSSSLLIVNISDINDNTPFFINFPPDVSIPENFTVGYFIAEAKANDLDSGNNALLVYQLANDEGRFSIDDNGRITLAASLDREFTDSYNITVTVTDRGQPPRTATEHLFLEVLDVNDVDPQFERDSFSFLINEDIEINSTLGELIAFDADEGYNGNITFDVISDDPRFSILTNQIESNSGRQTYSGLLISNQLFDYEMEISYSLRVRARNILPPFAEAVANVTLTIRDINDNAPTFSMPGGYTLRVPEAILPGTTIGTVVATDIDGGENGTVTYSIALGTEPITAQTFMIDNETGIISLQQSLNFEGISSYEFYVVATDLSPTPLSSNASVIVNVEDDNERAPEFDSNSYSVSVRESLPAKQFVVRVNATESEGGDASIRYSIIAGDTEKFSIDQVTGIILTNASLDRETQDSYVLTVQAMDMAINPLSSFAQVVVDVLDFNDNSPTFNVLSATINLLEGSTNGTRIAETFIATDEDIGSNAEIRYSLSPGSPFTVDPITGVISVAEPSSLDREITPTIDFELRAMDLGNPSTPLSTLPIRAVLGDINDNTPMFIQSSYTAEIRENLAAGVSVISVNATDSDLESALIYNIESGDDFANKFSINERSGLIETTAIPLDRETRQTYELVVSVTDSGSPTRMSTAVVTVLVLDENDNTPRCVQELTSFTTEEANILTVELGDVRATDADQISGENVGSGQITYELATDSYRRNISVSSSGTVSAYPNLDFEAVESGSFFFDVLVRDNPSNPSSSRSVTCRVQLTLIDTNDNIPAFNEDRYESTVIENAPVGTRVIIVQAEDIDSGRNGQFRYSFQTTVNAFAIDPISGEVTVAGTIDRESTTRYELDIGAIDEGTPSRVGTTVLIVTVIDTDDNSPRFERSFYDVAISEDAELDSTVITVQAMDRDSSKVTHRILSGNEQQFGNSVEQPFRIEAFTGVIQISRSLDRELIPVFNLVVLAEDDAGNNGTTIVRVTLIDVNDEEPTFQLSGYTAYIDENSLEGTPVLPSLNGTIIQIQAIDRDEPNTINSSVFYRLEGSNAALFNIDVNSGIVTVARGANLDFETSRTLPVTVVATDSALNPRSSSVTLTVELMDVNDESPTFTSPFGYSIPVSEGTNELTVISTELRAVDRETVGGMVNYALTSAVPLSALSQFGIDRESGDLTLLQSLDRETDSTITLVVTASDMGEPALSSVVNVRITVSDVNDNPPQFSQDIYTATVPEFLAIGASAFQVSAMDPDAPGVNSEVRYEVLPNPPAPFDINPITGVITTLAALDHETEPFHTFRVQACDRGQNRQCSETMIRINVADFNDERPTFDQPTYITDVCYHSAMSGVVLIQPVATDRDSGSNAELLYSLDGSSLFSIAPSTGRVELAGNPAVGEYTFTVTATDSGTTPLFSSTEVTIRVLNCSANDIFFSEPFYYFEIDEGVNTFRSGGSSVGGTSVTISTSGPLPQAAIISFSPNLDTNPFINVLNHLMIKPIVDLNVDLRERNGLDREARSLYTVILRAQVANQAPIFTSVTLQVIDTNDNGPEFSSDLFIFMVRENLTAPVIAGTVEATDRDEGLNGEIEYRILRISPPSSPPPFVISGTTGLISTAVELDREGITEYELTIEAGDGASTDTSSVQISVEDVNDCDPMFMESAYQFYVGENLPAGTSVGTVRAVDCDEGVNAALEYTIASGGLGVFRLDLVSGVITTLSVLDYEQTTQYSLIVRATDMGFPSPRSTAVRVSLEVEDFNDCPPVFVNHPTIVTVPEDIGLNSVIQTFTVQDCDSGLNGVNATRFSIIAGNEEGVFEINSVSGVLRTVASLDREQRVIYILSIQARDSSPTNPLSSITELNVTVLDVNDNNPVFAEDEISIAVNEGEELGQVLISVRATDIDAGRNAQVEYYLAGGDPQEIFSVDGESGGLSLAQTLDRETEDRYELILVGRDRAIEPRSSNTTILITVLDENDNDPVILNIESGVTTEFVPEDTSNGTLIFAVNATDGDLGSNANLRYYLDDRSGNLPFDIVGGVVRLNGSLDYETQIIYSVVVVAEDMGSPNVRRGIATLVVQVTDSNDNSPVFVESEYSGRQDEGEEAGTSILRVQATDADEINSINSAVSYSLTIDDEYADYFTIDNSTGVIYNNRTLDREDIDEFSLNVVATNYLSEVPFSGTASVLISVGDVNDEVPVFNQSVYTATVAERTELGMSVLTVSAFDEDLADTPNSDLIFSLARQTNIPFFIEANTGILTIQNQLDYETSTSYDFDVVVEDKGAGPLHNTSTIIINITDINDQIPRFSQSFYTVRLLENSPPQTLLSLSYFDGDTLPQHTLSTLSIGSITTADGQLVGGNLLSISNNQADNTGQVSIEREVNFEVEQSYVVEIIVANVNQGVGETCEEAPSCRFSSRTMMEVVILDENDNTPVFSSSSYSGQLSDRAEPNTAILSVSATDADASQNFRSIVYELISDADGRFRVEPTTGTLFTQGDFSNLAGVTFTLIVSAQDNNGVEPFNAVSVTVSLVVLNDFQRVAIRFNARLDAINSKEDQIVSVLRNISGYEIIVEGSRELTPGAVTQFIFHAVDNGEIIDFTEFSNRIQNREEELFRRLSSCNITLITSFANQDDYTYPVLLDTETVVILVLCLLLIIGSIIVLIVAFRQRYLALHAARHKLLADVFYGSHAGSSFVDDIHHENIQLEMIENTGQSMNKQNPMFVHPYDNWAGVDTSGVESVGGDSNLQRDNPLYESQEIRMEMFADVSDEEEEAEDEADEAELLAAALQEDSDVEDEDNSVTAI